jgi:hypothetical protein
LWTYTGLYRHCIMRGNFFSYAFNILHLLLFSIIIPGLFPVFKRANHFDGSYFFRFIVSIKSRINDRNI